MPVFQSIRLQPSYGARKTLITWDLDPAYTGSVHIFRSPDGAGDWKLLNPTAVTSDNFYEDTTFTIQNRFMVPHYRLLLIDSNAVEHDSPIIGILDELRRQEYGGLSKIMKLEYLRMSRGNGVQVLHYKVKTRGTLSDLYDPETGAQIGDDSCDTDSSFGQKFVDGFRRPFLTWCEFLDVGPTLVLDKEKGLGAVDQHHVVGRFLAFPRLAPGDLIVHVPTDNRYAIGEEIKPFMFRGLMPVAYTAKMVLLQRNDPRYRVPLPDSLPPVIPSP
jgi:hypothetical protein